MTIEETLKQVLEELAEIKAAMLPKSKLIGIPEAALILGVSENTVRANLNEMPKNVGIGKHVKFERVAIEKMAKARNVGRPCKAA